MAVMKPCHRSAHPAWPSPARQVVKTLADTLAKKTWQETYHSEGEAEREAMLEALANMVAEIYTNFLADIGWWVHKGTCQHDASETRKGAGRNTLQHSARWL